MPVAFIGMLVANTAQSILPGSTPFRVANKHPFIAVQALPLADSAYVLKPGQSEWRASLDLANWQIYEGTTSEALQIDGESATLLFGWRRGVALGRDHRIDLGFELPLIRHSGGYFDRAIEQWHNIWGLPQNGRDIEPGNALRYHYQNGEGHALSLESDHTGFGDFRVLAGIPLLEQDRNWLGLRAMLKAPTGSSEELMGSGGWGGSFGVHWRHSRGGARKQIDLEMSAGISGGEPGDVLAELRRPVSAWASAMLGWHAADWVVLKAQFDAHTAYYDSALHTLDTNSGQLSIGATLPLPGNMALDLAVTEDVIVDTAPDIVFHLGWRKWIN